LLSRKSEKRFGHSLSGLFAVTRKARCRARSREESKKPGAKHEGTMIDHQVPI
jgi:hypothetical protein